MRLYFVVIPERETSDERPKHIWEDNPKINLKRQSGECGVELSTSGQGLVVGSFEYGDETSGCLNVRNFWQTRQTFWFHKTNN
jgi:hypothetical protein